MQVNRYLNKEYRTQAARILVMAFKPKLEGILGTEEEIHKVLLESLNSKYIVIVRSNEGPVIGVAAYQYKGNFTLDITLSTMIEVYGLFRGIYKMFSLLSYFPTKREQTTLYIDAIAVDDNYRGQGVGKLLLEELEKIAIENELSTVSLDVIKENIRAKKLYEEVGFEEVKYEELNEVAKNKLGFAGYYYMAKCGLKL